MYVWLSVCPSGYAFLHLWADFRDVNKATGHKAKARELKAKDYQHSPRPGQSQGQIFLRPGQGQRHNRHTATVLNQNKTSDVIYLLQSITVNNDKNKITVITSAIIFTAQRSYASAVLGVVILSVRLSVCHTRAL